LQVSQMMLETLRMAGWTGRRLTCAYCSRPKAAPTRAMIMPAHMRVEPFTMVPNTLNVMLSSIGGSFRSASLARAAGASASAATAAGAMNRVH